MNGGLTGGTSSDGAITSMTTWRMDDATNPINAACPFPAPQAKP